MDASDSPRLIYLGLLLLAVAGWVMAEYRGRLGQALRSFLAWGMIFLGVVALYGLWGDIRRDVLPQQQMTETGQLVIPRAADGHYYPRLQIAGQEITFMADTGATSVTLSSEDARKLGIDLGSLAYVNRAMTANGPVQTAQVTLQDVTLGPFHDATIRANVTQGDVGLSLLGMEYLGRFGIQIVNDRMTLTR
jgi:aspartyl protease family protein